MKILVAVDGSAGAAAAVKSVSQRPWPRGSIFRVLAVFSAPLPSNAARGGVSPELRHRYTNAIADPARDAASHAASLLETAGLLVETKVVEGDAGPAIVAHAERWNADLIVLGSRGLSRVRRVLLGSVATYVSANASCSVEIVRKKRKSSK